MKRLLVVDVESVTTRLVRRFGPQVAEWCADTPNPLAYLGVTNAFAMLRLLPMTDRDKDTEILALRHQITVLKRQLGNTCGVTLHG
ncbi:hypothetical protein [Streptomyces sp. OE57]|uniref:hypothetical protein n=1 Tax=Streptomyces lacaronensis TaxID=3379885 RepID=UPI0039B76A90